MSRLEIVSERIDAGGSRYYTDKDGVEYLSVTSLPSKYADSTFLENWRERIGVEEAERIVAERVAIGKAAHSAIEDHFAGTAVLNKYARNAINSFYSKVDIMACEEVVSWRCPEHGVAYAGRYDQVVRIAPETFCYADSGLFVPPGQYICDLKTKRRLPSLDSFSFYVKHLLQAAAYYNAMRDSDITGYVMVATGARKTRLFLLDVPLLEHYWTLYREMLMDYYGDRRLLDSGTYWDEKVNRPVMYDRTEGQLLSVQPHIIHPR